MSPRAPYTEEQKQVLRDRLKLAREAKAAKARQPKPPTPPVAPAPASTALADSIHHQWTEAQWMSNPIEACRSRLALLKVDFEVGARIVGQRPDINDPNSYECFVCHCAVPERSPSGAGSGWVWKHDYLDTSTGLYRSVVICSQKCHMVYSNDTRMQQTLKDLIAGRVGSQLVEGNLPVEEAE